MKKIFVHNPTIKRKDMDSVLSCLVSDKIDSGDIADEFIAKFCENVSHSNGYALREPAKALALLIKCLTLDTGKNIILSPLVPDFYNEAFELCNIQPRFCDVDIETGLITAESVEKIVDDNSVGIVLYDTLSNINCTEDFKKFNLPIIQDVTTSFGISFENGMAGAEADWIFCALELESMVVSGGGAVVTAKTKNSVGKLNRIFSSFSRESKMTNFNAALGLTQILSIKDSITKRKELYSIYKNAFFKSKNKSLKLSKNSEGFFYAFPVLTDIGSKDIIKYAKKYDIEVLLPFENSILNRYQNIIGDFRNSLSLINRVVVFPLHPMIGKSSVDLICKILATIP